MEAVKNKTKKNDYYLATAVYQQFDPRTIARAISQKEFPKAIKGAGRKRFPKREVDEWIEKMRASLLSKVSASVPYGVFVQYDESKSVVSFSTPYGFTFPTGSHNVGFVYIKSMITGRKALHRALELTPCLSVPHCDQCRRNRWRMR